MRISRSSSSSTAGGWTTESVETYDRVCSRMAQSIGQMVISVEYRLAPEYRFPTGFEDCYSAAKALFAGEILPGILPEQITVMGDSAGGNLAAAVCMRARDTGDFSPQRQILIYPALSNCYTEDSPYESVRTNGTGYLLTSEKMADYLKLYESKPEDRENPYFAPLCAEDYSNLPDTLILTAEYDPLRGRRGRVRPTVEAVRMPGAYRADRRGAAWIFCPWNPAPVCSGELPAYQPVPECGEGNE